MLTQYGVKPPPELELARRCASHHAPISAGRKTVKAVSAVKYFDDKCAAAGSMSDMGLQKFPFITARHSRHVVQHVYGKHMRGYEAYVEVQQYRRLSY